MRPPLLLLDVSFTSELEKRPKFSIFHAAGLEFVLKEYSELLYGLLRTVQQLRGLAVGILPQRSTFSFRMIIVWFLIDEEILEQVFLRSWVFSNAQFNLPSLTHNRSI